MPKRFLLAVLLVLVLPVTAGSDGTEGKGEAELYHTPAEMAAAGEWTMISERVAFSGLVEVDLTWEDTDGEGSSDIVLSTAQLGFRGMVSEEYTVLLVADYDEEESRFTIDEATIDHEGEDWYMRLGIQDVVFGHYPSHFISGPPTEDLGETKETAVLAGYAPEPLDIAVWAANGDADRTDGEDRIDDFGISVLVTPHEDLELGASFISDLADTDALLLGQTYTERVSGVSAFFILGFGDLEFVGEYLSASNKMADLNSDGTGDTPSAFNTEIAWELKDNAELAIRVGGSSEFPDAPESQYGLCFSYGIRENVSLSMEYLREEFDSAYSGEEERHAVTTRLGVQF